MASTIIPQLRCWINTTEWYKPWLKKGWCIPPKANAEFVAAMEDGLAVSCRPYDPARPKVNLNEASKQLLAHVHEPLPMRPGYSERVDGEYERKGIASLFTVCESLAGKRHVFVRARRKRQDFAAVIKTLCDERYARAEKIVLVMDPLHTHGVASLYAAYPPKPGAWPSGWKSTTPPSMAAG